jgi:hypothetical protein
MFKLLSCTFIIYAFMNILCGLLSAFFYFGSRKADAYVSHVLQNDEFYCLWEIGDIALLPRPLPSELGWFVNGH